MIIFLRRTNSSRSFEIEDETWKQKISHTYLQAAKTLVYFNSNAKNLQSVAKTSN